MDVAYLGQLSVHGDLNLCSGCNRLTLDIWCRTTSQFVSVPGRAALPEEPCLSGKQALVSSYVGTVAVGWIFAQGIVHFTYVFSVPISSWIARDEYRGIIAQSTVKGFMFRDGLPELVRSIALLILGYLLLRWLYFGPFEQKSNMDDATKASESATGAQLA